MKININNMSRPSEIYTKTVSVRIPMDSYIELLQDATSNKLSVSELITLRLFAENGKNKMKTDENDGKKWSLVESFSNKELYKHKHIKGISGMKVGDTKYSKDGKHKITAIRNAHSKVYELK